MIPSRRWAVVSIASMLIVLWLHGFPISLISIYGVRRDVELEELRNKTSLLITSHHEKNLRPAAFQGGALHPIGKPYTKMLVVPRTKDDDVRWIQEHFGNNDYVNSSVYFAGNIPGVSLHVTKNKGHEVMVYLSYIIENYNNLADVNIFMHAHRMAWHNNELLDHDAVQVIARLSAERVQREGYVNLRCHWEPGCPSWMHPGALEEDLNKQEETMLARAWIELFPSQPIPNVLAQPCCAQFAVSDDRIRALPRSTYVYYRDWLLETQLSDYISGRVWEYIWQYVFTGESIDCPKEHICYCDGFGVCFGGESEYNAYWTRHGEMRKLEKELQEETDKLSKLSETTGDLEEEKNIMIPASQANMALEEKIKELKLWCDRARQLAKEHGDVALHRALEAGRPWSQGGGF